MFSQKGMMVETKALLEQRDRLLEVAHWLVGAFDAGALTIRPDYSVGMIAKARTILGGITTPVERE
jgi:hypothetical protein